MIMFNLLNLRNDLIKITDYTTDYLGPIKNDGF